MEEYYKKSHKQQMDDSDIIFTAISTGAFESYKEAEEAVIWGYVVDHNFSRGGISHALNRLKEFYAERNKEG